VSFYTDSEMFYAVMTKLFEQVAADATATGQFKRSKMAIRFRCTGPEAELLIDGRHNPVQVAFGPQSQAGRVDLDLTLPADLLHDIWLGRVRLRDAFGDGRMKVGGNIFKAMQLGDLFRRTEALYPVILQEMGYSAA